MLRSKTVTLIALAAAVVGCKDMGLDDNLPLGEAEDRPPSALVAAVMRPVETVDRRFIVDGKLWVPSGMPAAVREAELQAIGSAGGRTLHARRWDAPPYDALFVRMEEEQEPRVGALAPEQRWQELAPVIGRSGALPAGPDHPAAPSGRGADPTPGGGSAVEGGADSATSGGH